jgi:hypothetical protein
MLNYSVANYCMLIWDDERTTSGMALKTLQTEIPDDRSADHMTVTFKPFQLENWTLDEKAKKVLEEAAEIRGELQYENLRNDQMPHGNAIQEAFDTMQAAANFIASALPDNNVSWQDLYDKIVKKNMERGYYDE